MPQATDNNRAGGATALLEDPWKGIRRQIRIRNFLLIIVAVEVIAFEALRWWATI